MEEWILEIETKKTIKKVKNPRKVIIKDFILFYSIKVLDNDGKWHHIANTAINPYWTAPEAKKKIEKAIKKKLPYVEVNI